MNRVLFVTVAVLGCALTSPKLPMTVAAVRPFDELGESFEPATDERKLWEEADEQIRELADRDELVEDAGLQTYLSEVATGLLAQPLPAGAPPIRVRVVRIPRRNAAMLPNGVILVSLGLLCAMENEAQLAAVLGHEVGHHLSRDNLREFRYRESSESTIDRMTFSRRVEESADKRSQDLMRRAGYDPAQAVAQLELMRREAGGGEARVSYLASHPDIEARLAYVKAQLTGRGPPSGRVASQAYEAAVTPHLLEGAKLDLRRGELRRARATIDRFLHIRPDSGRGHFLYAELLRRVEPEGDASPRVREAYDRAASLNTADPEVQRGLGLFYRERGCADAARRAFARYLELAPDAPDRNIVTRYLEAPDRPRSSKQPD